MKKIIAMLFGMSVVAVHADTYTLGISWVDATVPGMGYDPLYSIQVEQDGVLLVEALDLQTPSSSHTWTAPAGISIVARMRNSNEVVSPSIDGAWSADVVAQLAESPAPISVSTVVLQHSP